MRAPLVVAQVQPIAHPGAPSRDRKRTERVAIARIEVHVLRPAVCLEDETARPSAAQWRKRGIELCMDLFPRSYNCEGIIARENKLVNAPEHRVEAGLRPRVPKRRPVVVVVRRLLLRPGRALSEARGAHLRKP